MEKPLYAAIAELVAARDNCKESAKRDATGHYRHQMQLHEQRLLALVTNHMPSGAGFDNATTIELDRCSRNMLVFTVRFHHMNEQGSYDGWTTHTVRVTPDMVSDIQLSISGRNRNDVKEHIHQAFDIALRATATWIY